MKLTHPASTQTIEVADAAAERYLSQGWRKASTDAPKASASKADWLAYALAQGLPGDEAEAMTRDELRAALS